MPLLLFIVYDGDVDARNSAVMPGVVTARAGIGGVANDASAAKGRQRRKE